jgi:hypothetical protein
VGAAFGAKKLYVGDRPLTVGVWYVPTPFRQSWMASVRRGHVAHLMR